MTAVSAVWPKEFSRCNTAMKFLTKQAIKKNPFCAKFYYKDPIKAHVSSQTVFDAHMHTKMPVTPKPGHNTTSPFEIKQIKENY